MRTLHWYDKAVAPDAVEPRVSVDEAEIIAGVVLSDTYGIGALAI